MRKLVAFALALTMVFSFGAAAFAEGEEEPVPVVVKVGIAVPAEEKGWAAGAAYYAEKYCEENGIEYQIETAENAAKMRSALKQLVRWGATAVVIDPQWPELEEAVQEVLNAGIPVVNIGMDVACDGIYKVVSDNYNMGYLCAMYMVDAVGNGAIVEVIDAPSIGAASEQRKQGFYDYLAAIGYDTSYVFEAPAKDVTREAGAKSMEDGLEDYKQIDGVFSIDDELSMGAVDAITEAGRSDVKVVTGGGGCQEYFKMIADEQYLDMGLFTVLNSPAIVENAIEVAAGLINGVWYDWTTVVPTGVVNSENVEEYLDPENTVY